MLMRHRRASSAHALPSREANASSAQAFATADDRLPKRPQRITDARTIGLFGLLGSGNIGNDACMESVIAYLKRAHPDAVVDAMCSGPQQVRKALGIQGIPLFWYRKGNFSRLRVIAPILKMLGKGIDVLRTAAWVRRHDVIVVPGMGVLETDMPISAFGFPYAIFLISLFGRVLGTKVAFISVGANAIQQPATRWFLSNAARLASYRSYRDVFSRQAMQAMGVDTEADDVFPDVAFGLPAAASRPYDPTLVAVGVINFHGSNDDRAQAAEIYAQYLDKMTSFVTWLVENGRTVRLVVGDAKCDGEVVQEIIARVLERIPDLDAGCILAEPICTAAQLVDALGSAASVVASRYHNVIFALKLNKPTMAIAYAPKLEVLMNDMGLSGFLEYIRSFDVKQLIEKFIQLETGSALLRQEIFERNAMNASQVEQQFKKLSETLFSHDAPRRFLPRRAIIALRSGASRAQVGDIPE
jgi:polysaccharide pyruvyl transferase WcaK-like protein